MIALLLRLRCRFGWLGHDPDYARPKETEDWTEYPCRRCGAYLIPSVWAGLPGAPSDPGPGMAA